MKRASILLALFLAVPLFASTGLFSRYEAVRQGLLTGKLDDVRTSAKALVDAANEASNADVARAATKVSKSADLKAARNAFAELSDEMIKVRNAVKEGERPMIAYCPMVNKSWLQQKGEIGNPYDAAMAKCGVLKD